MNSTTIKIDGMHCDGCAARIRTLLSKEPGVRAARVSFAGGSAEVRYLFGLALSLPLVLAAAFAPAHRALDWLAGLSRRIPFWTGVVLIVLGLWSIGFGLFMNLEDWI